MEMQLQLDQDNTRNAILIAQANLQKKRRKKQNDKEAAAKKIKKKRSIWIRKWLRRRPNLGQYTRLVQELKKEDEKGYYNFLRMDYNMFKEILQRIEGRITKTTTNFRKPLSPALKLAITLRYIAAGDSYHSLMYGFRVAHNTISKLIQEVCEAIISEFSEELVPVPSTPEEWNKISDDFSSRWNFHHCLGALDGKHIAIRCPKQGGSLYYNYKGFHSIILMAMVDADYKFTWVDVGSHGSAGDAQVFNNSELKEAIDKGVIGFPEAESLPDDDVQMPYFIAADDAFALRSWLMKPFSKRKMENTERIFNYRLSRARRVVENAFGILAHRFRCMLTTMQQDPETVTSIVLACVCLHNLLRIRKPKEGRSLADQEDDDHNIIPGDWRKYFPLLDGASDFARNTTSRTAKKQREYLCGYYNSSVGSVSWQNDMI